jgi:hypothetical protein
MSTETQNVAKYLRGAPIATKVSFMMKSNVLDDTTL